MYEFPWDADCHPATPEEVEQFERDEAEWIRRHGPPRELIVEPETEPFAPPTAEEEEMWKTFRRQKRR